MSDSRVRTDSTATAPVCDAQVTGIGGVPLVCALIVGHKGQHQTAKGERFFMARRDFPAASAPKSTTTAAGTDSTATAAWPGLNPPYSTIVADPPWPYDDQVGAWDERGAWLGRRRRGSSGREVFDLVERVSPPPRVELFARAPRLGWDHWGKGYEVAS